jgi:hypothetical protein
MDGISDVLYLLECKMGCLSEIWCLNMWGRLKLMYEASNQTVPNWITVNQTMWSQTKACITKSSCVNKQENKV